MSQSNAGNTLPAKKHIVKRSGPPKTPTNLKLLKGTFRQDRVAPNEPKPEVAIPPVPPHLSDEAKVEWVRVSGELATLGLLTRIDRAALATYCECWSDWVKATTKVHETGEVIKTTAGNVIENPYYSIKKRSAELMHKFLTEFGMTPASRTRINAAPQESEKSDRWKGFGA
jgi:P27 family predicted phage terminase small subunit